MKPSDLQPEDSDVMAADLAADMLAFVNERYRSANSDEERLRLTLEYAPVVHMLQRTVRKATRKEWRYPGVYEQKGA